VSRSRMGFLLTRVCAVLGACLAGLLAASAALPGEAAAATLPPAVSAQLARSQLAGPLLAAAAPTVKTVKTVKADYTCDFSAYGPGIAAATTSVTAQAATSWPVNQPDDVVLDNDAIALPSAVTGRLNGVDSVVVASQVTAKRATKATIELNGATLIDATSAPTEIPDIVTLGQVTFAAKGSDGSVALPAQSITFTPMAGTTAKPVITCTTAKAAQDIAITVGDASGPFYHCVTTFATESPSDSAGLFPVTITETGTKKTGDSVTVTVTSPDAAALIQVGALIISAAGGTLDKAVFSADLPVTGAQSGTVHITKTVIDPSATTLSASAKLKLTKKGTVKVDIPSKLGVALSASGTVVLDIACTLVTKPAPVALTLTVAQGPISTPSATASATNSSGDSEDTGATPEATGTPIGGAATGGGPAPGSNMPLAFGGIALLLVGGGLILSRWRTGASSAARRRRALGGARGSAGDAPDGPSGDSPGGPAA
jgi:hypothetical protein